MTGRLDQVSCCGQQVNFPVEDEGVDRAGVALEDEGLTVVQTVRTTSGTDVHVVLVRFRCRDLGGDCRFPHLQRDLPRRRLCGARVEQEEHLVALGRGRDDPERTERALELGELTCTQGRRRNRRLNGFLVLHLGLEQNPGQERKSSDQHQSAKQRQPDPRVADGGPGQLGKLWSLDSFTSGVRDMP